MQTFRRIRPQAVLGHYTGPQKNATADVVFASIQTLGRSQHLSRFQSSDFDYIVVDEFHHASAATYRRLIDHFEPRFLFGLTATPERSDGGDLFGFCQENLVYRRRPVRRNAIGLLRPFQLLRSARRGRLHNIPWRSTRFDEDALTEAVATQYSRATCSGPVQHRGGIRTLAFCVSQRHADFMAGSFEQRDSSLQSIPDRRPRQGRLA